MIAQKQNEGKHVLHTNFNTLNSHKFSKFHLLKQQAALPLFDEKFCDPHEYWGIIYAIWRNSSGNSSVNSSAHTSKSSL